METLAINGQSINVQGIKELKAGMSIQEATLKTKKNGLDEVYSTVDGKNFLAYGDSLNIKGLSKNEIASVTYNGRQATVVAHEDEINSVGQGIVTGALNGFKKTRESIFGASNNIITSIGPTSVLAVGGAIGLTGLALWRGGMTAATSGAVSAASPLGNMLGDLLKNGSIGALKVIAVAGAIGFGLTAVAGAIGGVSEALSTDKDYSTIAFVTRDGNEGGSGASNTPVQTPVQNPVSNNSGSITNSAPDNIFTRPPVMTNQFNAVSGYLSGR